MLGQESQSVFSRVPSDPAIEDKEKSPSSTNTNKNNHLAFWGFHYLLQLH